MKKLILIIIFLMNLSVVSASVGVGVSPAKLSDTIFTGEVKEYDYIIYNTGDINITAKISIEGELSDYIDISEKEIFLLPEPEPHRLPPVNGKITKIRIKSPLLLHEKNYTSKVVASVNPGFGGLITTGAVASNIYITVKPRYSFYFKYIILLFIIIVFYLVIKKRGSR
ncbi:hypothetical protein J4476_04340 [Candidatus Woesearchaeota archaeon]|nr:hypothetical protein [Candidatus Woesearchaeota archaeon]HIH25192.1 hypothetical protein [Nanoarchaeota archaeon]